MILGIVGHEAAKFTPQTEQLARTAIRNLLAFDYNPELVLSGGCHLGGIDIWAEEEADKLRIPFKAYHSITKTWSGPGGYRERNLRIANHSDRVACIVVKELPPTYKGMRFNSCYHCKNLVPPHVKSGGCWTAWKAPKKPGSSSTRQTPLGSLAPSQGKPKTAKGQKRKTPSRVY